MPGVLENQPHPEAARGARAGFQVLPDRIDPPQVVEHVAMESPEAAWVHGLVAIPPDLAGAARFAHDVLVLRGAPCMGRGIDNQRPVPRQNPFPALQCEFYENCLDRICGARSESFPRQAAHCARAQLLVQL